MKTVCLIFLVACVAGLLIQNSAAQPLVLKGAKLDGILLLYGEYSGRTVLRHPALTNSTFTLECSSTNRSEILQHLEAAFAEKEIIVVPDGAKFVLIGPKSQRSQLAPGATNIVVTATKVYPKGTFHFVNATVGQVMAIYADLIGKKLEQNDSLPPILFVSLIQTSELTKDECRYAFETLLRWQGWKLTPAGDDSIKPVPAARMPEAKQTK